MVKMHKPSIRMAPSTLRLAPTPAATRRTRGKAWMETRARILSRDQGICRCDECTALGRTLLATEVDHTTPLEQGGTDDDDNLMSMHKDCHAKKTAAEAKERASR